MMKHTTFANARELRLSNIANFSDESIYSVQIAGLSYTVRSNGYIVECTCPDYAKGNVCQHSCAVHRHEECLRRRSSARRTVQELNRLYEPMAFYSRKISTLPKT